MPEEYPELRVHCIIQCQRRIRSFPSTVLYSARGGSEATHKLIQSQAPDPASSRMPARPNCKRYQLPYGLSVAELEALLSRANGNKFESSPVQTEEAIISPTLNFPENQNFPSTVLYSARGGSGASRPLYYTVPEEDPELPVHCIIQCQTKLRSFPDQYYTVPEEAPKPPLALYNTVPGKYPEPASRPLYTYSATQLSTV